DAGLVHAHGEGGDAAVLGRLRIGPRQHEAPVRLVRVAGPDLVTRDHVLVAVGDGSRPPRREVGSGPGPAEPLAPPVPTADDPGDERRADVLVAVAHDALDEVADARTRRRTGGRELLVEDHVVDRGQTLTSGLDGPRHAEESRLVQRAVPGSLPRPVLVRGRG